MNDARLYCIGPECEEPVAGHGLDLCSSHLKQHQRTGKLKPIAQKVSPEERAIQAGTAMLEADSDEEYSAKRRSWLIACKALGRKGGDQEQLGNIADRLRAQRSAEVRAGLSAARAKGVQLGRPPKVSLMELERLFRLLGSGLAVARVLGVHQAGVNARLAKAFGKRRISRIDRSEPPGPRPT